MIEDKLLLQVPTEDDVRRFTPPHEYLMLDRVVISALAYIGALVARCELLDKQMIHIESRLSKLESGKNYVTLRGEPVHVDDLLINRILPASLVPGDKE